MGRRCVFCLVFVWGLAGCGDSGRRDADYATAEKSIAPASGGASPSYATPPAAGEWREPAPRATPTFNRIQSGAGDRDVDDVADAPAFRHEPAPRGPSKPAIDAAHSEASAPSESVPPPSTTTPAQPKAQSGQLTAGSIDDQRNFADYRAFLERSAQHRWLREYSPASRVVVTVENEAGERVPDARIVVRQEQAEERALTTGSDGRAVFLAGLDLPPAVGACTVTVTAPNSNPVVKQCSTQDADWTIVVPDAPHALPTRLDLALVIDATGSMTDEIRYLQAEIDDIVAAVKERYPRIAQRFGLVVFRDHGDEFVTRQWDFIESLPEFQKRLNAQRAAGGGDMPEAVDEALEQAASLSWSSNGAARVLFFVGDAPPHTRNAGRAFQAVQKLQQRGVSVFPVACSGVDDEAEYLFRAAAFLTRGQYLFLTDHSGIGLPHAKPQTPRYEVERLDQLMIRMIAWKLSGLEYQPDQIIDVGGDQTLRSSSAGPVQPPIASAPPAPPAHFAPSAAVPGGHDSWRHWMPEVPRSLVSVCVVIAVLGLAFGDYFVAAWRKRKRG